MEVHDVEKNIITARDSMKNNMTLLSMLVMPPLKLPH